MVALLLLFILLLIIFSIPAVQTGVAKKLTDSLNEKNHVNVSIGSVKIGYLGKVKLKNVYVEDHHEDTLIFAQQLKTSMLSLSRLLNNSPNFGRTTVEGAIVKMKKYKGEEKDNFSIFLDKLKKEPSGDTTHFELSVSDVEILNSHYSYRDMDLDNPDAVVVDSLNIYAKDLRVDGPKISTHINSLQGKMQRGIDIEDLSTDFSYSHTQMVLDNLHLETPGSDIKAEIVFDYDLQDFADFVNKVQITAQFNDSRVSSHDLKGFYDGFGDGQYLNLNTKLTGTLNSFHLSDLALKGLDRTGIYGEIQIDGAFTEGGKDFKLNGDVSEFTTNYYDLVNFLPGPLRERLSDRLAKFGNVRMQGNTTITTTSLDADAIFVSQLGSAKANIVLRNMGQEEGQPTYKGNLVFRDFNIGRFLDSPKLGKTSFNVDVDGRGFEKQNLNAQLKGKISKLTYNNYTYKNIRVIGNLRNPLFNGYFVARDPNLQMEFNGLVDVSKDINVYDFEASVSYANLHALNFISRDSISIFKGDVIMNMRGTTVDNAVGNIMLLNTSYRNAKDLYHFDDFSITSSFEGQERTIKINSPDVISGEVSGNFKLSEVPALFENSLGSIYTNYKPSTITRNQYMEYNFEIYNQIVEIFFPKINLAPNTVIKGRVESDESEFRLNFRSPKIKAYGNTFDEVNLQVDNTNPIYNTFFEADSVSTGLYNFSEFSFINMTQRDTLYIRSEFRGGKHNDDYFNINLFHTINEKNKSVVGIQKSDVKFRNNIWYLNPEANKSNKIVFDDNFSDIAIDSLVMKHENEEIRLSGVMHDTTYKNFQMEFDNVDIAKITPEIDSLDLAGRLDGKLDLLQEKGAYFPNTSMTVDSLKVNDRLLGDLKLDVKGNKNLTNYDVNATLMKEGFESLNAVGNIDVSNGSPTIDLDVDLEKLNMAAFSPLGGEVLSNMRGYASGQAKVQGNYKNPDITGQLKLSNAGLTIPYLNVDLAFNEPAVVDLTQQKFVFDDIGIRDTKFNTTGVLNGSISHHNFTEWKLDLGISTDRLLVLDTDATEDALYYGTAFISGNASISGPTDELLIEVNGRTERGTTFKIPLNDTESVGDNSYIHFLSPEEKAAKLAGEEINLPEVTGLELVFDLDVTKQAEVEVVVDQTSGSTLKGRGAGNLLLEINTNGKFNMWGDFIVYEGVYNFKYAGLVQKVFDVKSGGSINWDGNPTKAQLDVSAVYGLNANPAVLLENPSINRKIPVDVVINLQGQIEQPDITFDVQFPTASSVVRSELEYRMDDRASKELQALFLVTQGSFYSEFGLRQNAITGTLAERASSIVNDIFADDEGKFQVGVNYVQGDHTPDQQTVDRFGLTLSTQISDRVLINGQVGVPIGGVTESVIIGDVEIDFLLNEDGTLRAKVFNRENNIQFIGEEIGFTQGVGLSYSVDFDTFKELLRKIMNTELTKGTGGSDTANQKVENSLLPSYINFPGEAGH